MGRAGEIIDKGKVDKTLEKVEVEESKEMGKAVSKDKS